MNAGHKKRAVDLTNDKISFFFPSRTKFRIRNEKPRDPCNKRGWKDNIGGYTYIERLNRSILYIAIAYNFSSKFLFCWLFLLPLLSLLFFCRWNWWYFKVHEERWYHSLRHTYYMNIISIHSHSNHHIFLFFFSRNEKINDNNQITARICKRFLIASKYKIIPNSHAIECSLCWTGSEKKQKVKKNAIHKILSHILSNLTW